MKLNDTHIKLLSVSESAKLTHFLAELTLRDHSPSQLQHKMKQLGGDEVRVELLKCGCSDSESLEMLAKTADKIHEVYACPVVSEVLPQATGVLL